MIKKIKWKEQHVLGNLELDFCKKDDICYNTIILAGENGTGKTTILETLAEVLTLGSIQPFESIEYIIDGNAYIIKPSNEYPDDKSYHERYDVKKNETEDICRAKNINEEEIDNDKKDIRHYGCVYSMANTVFRTEKITSIQTEDIDSKKYDVDYNDNFTSIKQLLVDIDSRDCKYLQKLCESGKYDGNYEESFLKRTKIYRFKRAFNDFFDDLKFDRINNDFFNDINILFKKYGKTINIDNLSSGEKQIVFRGAYLLKNSQAITGGIVLIDEPELSMHPKWQEKILKYYRDLFVEDNEQTVQIILATHSEYILKSALNCKEDILIINLKNNNGSIEAERIAHTRKNNTSAEINYKIFDIISTDLHIQLFGYLQSKFNKERIRECDDLILEKLNNKEESYKNKYIVENLGLPIDEKHVDKTLPVYIRNAIDHPDSARKYEQKHLRDSIELLIELCDFKF